MNSKAYREAKSL